MSKLNLSNSLDLLQKFEFGSLFTQELGWSHTKMQALAVNVNGTTFSLRAIAELGGIVVFEVMSPTDAIPDAKTRLAVQKEIAKKFYENVLIFVGQKRTQSLWYWVKRDDKKRAPRDHHYFRGQPADLMLSKLSAMFFDISDFDADGHVSIVEVAKRLQDALDVEQVTKKFYREYQDEHVAFTELIEGIDDERDQRWYASVLLNRLMFIYFLQRKFFLDNGNEWYLQHKLAASKKRGQNRFYGEFLRALFFEGFAKPEQYRSDEAKTLVGNIKYLNGGLFLPHKIEQKYENIRVPDKAFENLFVLFQRYAWNLDDTPGGKADEINPDVLGYIFEKYINQKEFGAYYTRPEITEYLCEQTIHKLILDKVNHEGVAGIVKPRQFASMPDLLMNLDAPLCRELLNDVLPKLSFLDPACGSGAFLVAAMKTLINIYSAIVGKIQFLNDPNLNKWLKDASANHRSLNYFLKKKIITDNLFGVDIMEEGAEIARLRLFLALVGSVESVDQLEPLPNIDFNILVGNSLIGLLRVDEKQYDERAKQGRLFQKPYREIVAEKERLIRAYRDAATYAEDLRKLRDEIDAARTAAAEELNDLLLNEFQELGIQYEEYHWDEKKKIEIKKKRAVRIGDIQALHPFHWGYEFANVMNERGGFDAIITNPPWEIFKPNGKEFFEQYSELVSKKNMRIEEFEQEREKLLRDSEVRQAWLKYLSEFPHVGAYYRSAKQYVNQISIVNGRKAASDTNLYKLFVEQCYNLLRDGGQCGIIVPSGIYTDLGTKQLRELLLSKGQIRTLFGLSNEKFIFENVHHGFKFTLLVFKKAGRTESFTAAFRINPREAVAPSELGNFLSNSDQHITIPVRLVLYLSPDSMSIMEFRQPIDIHVASKLLRFPLLGEVIADVWNLTLFREFDMTNDAELFKTSTSSNRTVLYEGKMIWQFEHRYAEPRYWINTSEGRKAILGSETDKGQKLEYQNYRVGLRAVAGSVNERSMVATVIPRNVFCGNSLLVSKSGFQDDTEKLFCVAVLDSFVIDWLLRQKVTTNINMFYVYQLPIPRFTSRDPAFAPIVERAARLICTTPEFDDLAKEVGLKSHKDGGTDPKQRAQLRAELDGMIAHLYHLTEQEFTHILSTFPLVEQSVKDAALDAYRAFAPNPNDQQLRARIKQDENATLEFKVAAYWNAKTNQKDGTMKENVLQAVASFMNSSQGGDVIIGVENGTCAIVGLEADYAAVDPGEKNRGSYELWLRNIIATVLGANVTEFYETSFHELEGKDILRIRVKPATHPIYLNGDLYIRDGNGKRKLKAAEVVPYIKQRWGL